MAWLEHCQFYSEQRARTIVRVLRVGALKLVLAGVIGFHLGLEVGSRLSLIRQQQS
jgi:hypothetical protein